MCVPLPRPLLLAAFGAGLTAGALPAQAPRSPTTPHDSQAQVIERLHVAARFHSDGTSEVTTRLRVRIQSELAVRLFGQLIFPYSAAFQDVLINQIGVHKASGSVVTAGADAVQDVGSEVQQLAPVYTDERQKHVTVPSLRPGDVLEYDVTYRTHTPLAPGQFWFEHEFGLGAVVLDERLELDLPADRAVIVKTRRGPAPSSNEQDGRRWYVWQTLNSAPVAD